MDVQAEFLHGDLKPLYVAIPILCFLFQPRLSCMSVFVSPQQCTSINFCASYTGVNLYWQISPSFLLFAVVYVDDNSTIFEQGCYPVC
eukprot:c13707_g3_i1 orf=30-293(+)